MKLCSFGTVIGNGDANQNIVGRIFGVLGNDIEVAVVVESAGVFDFVFQIFEPAFCILGAQLLVRKLALWILVQRFQIRMRR